MHSVTEPAFRCTCGSKWSEDVTFSNRFAVFAIWRGSSWTVDDITVVADALASGAVAYVLGRRDESTGAPTGVDWMNSPQNKRGARNACCTSFSQLARKASVEFGTKVPWTTAYDATTGVHKSLKRVRAQCISAQNIGKRRLWCQLLMFSMKHGTGQAVFRGRNAKCSPRRIGACSRTSTRHSSVSGTAARRPCPYRMVHRRTVRNAHGCS